MNAQKVLDFILSKASGKLPVSFTEKSCGNQQREHATVIREHGVDIQRVILYIGVWLFKTAKTKRLNPHSKENLNV